MFDLIKDFMNSILGAAIILISIIFIPELKKYRLIAICAVILLAYLGGDKIYRDYKTSGKNETRRTEDSTKIADLNTSLNGLSEGRKQDSANFAEFTRRLEAKFNIKDSANFPVKTINYSIKFRDAQTVNIGR